MKRRHVIALVRRLYLVGGLSIRQVALRVGLGHSYVGKMCRGLRTQQEAAVLRWRHRKEGV